MHILWVALCKALFGSMYHVHVTAALGGTYRAPKTGPPARATLPSHTRRDNVADVVPNYLRALLEANRKDA